MRRVVPTPTPAAAASTNKRPRPRRVPAAVAAACVLFVLASLADEFSHLDGAAVRRRRLLRSDGGVDGGAVGGTGTGEPSLRDRIMSLLARLRSDASSIDPSEVRSLRDALAPQPSRSLASRGPGPALVAVAGPGGRSHRWFRGDDEATAPSPSSSDGTGAPAPATWYAALSSPRMRWNVAPYGRGGGGGAEGEGDPPCPDGEGASMADTGFQFLFPDPQDPENPRKTTSRHLRFRIERRPGEDGGCPRDGPRGCLAGGRFVMNLDKVAKDVLYPGDYSLKTSEGPVRVVAYNAHEDCGVRDDVVVDAPPVVGDEVVGDEEDPNEEGPTPLDYLRRIQPYAANPEGCRAWIERQREEGDLFAFGAFDSDLSTVQVDTPWMQVIVQVRRDEAATEERCVGANMSVWIANVSPDLLGEEPGGVLGEGGSAASAEEGETASAGDRVLKTRDDKAYEVDGPFGI